MTVASTNHGAHAPNPAHAVPATKNAGGPSSASARAAARHAETYDTSVFDVRTTRTRSDVVDFAMTILAHR